MSYAPLDESERALNGIGRRIHHAAAADNDVGDTDERIRSPQLLFSASGSGGMQKTDFNRQALSEPLTQGEQQPHQSQQHSSKAMSTDPFYVFREDLYRQLERVDEALAEYLRVVHQTVGRTRRSSEVSLDTYSGKQWQSHETGTHDCFIRLSVLPCRRASIVDRILQ
jgi:hypothetical protein